MITDLRIHDSNYTVDGKLKLSNLSKVNIFLGANNSGKSRFLRSICSNELKVLTNLLDKNFLLFFNEFKEIYDSMPVKNEYLKKTYDIISDLSLEKGDIYAILDALKALQNLSKPTSSSVYDRVSWEGKRLKPELHRIVNLYSHEDIKVKKINYKLVYIPMLRGLRGYDEYTKESIDNVYDLRTVKDYFSTESAKDYNYDIFTGLTLYEDIKNMLLGSLEMRELVYSFEKFLSDSFFGGEPISLIPRTDSDVLFIKIGKQEERAIYDLGDGLQSIIINTFPLFKYKGEDLLMFIEEPEMTMHPGMQRKLINVFCEQKNVQFFITTHSNHLLDVGFDFEDEISTYTCEKVNDNEFHIKNKTKNKDVLDILGVRNSSVFLSNCVIWVEGISDRLLINKFIQLYLESDSKLERIDEDRHFSILEYGGGNITHFNFDMPDNDAGTMNIELIQKNNFIVVDNDGNWDGKKFKPNEKGERLEKLTKIFGNNIFYDHREIENTLGVELFEEYLSAQDDTGKPIYLKRKDLEYDSKDKSKINMGNDNIGKILKKDFVSLKDGVQEPKYFQKNDITLIDSSKANFARDIIKIITDKGIKFQDLDGVAQDMTKKIYNFIIESNK